MADAPPAVTAVVDPLAALLPPPEPEPAETPPDFFDAPFSEIDGRFIVSGEDWRDYLHDLDRLQRAPHRCARPTEYPCYVTTAFLMGEWVHQSVGLSWLGYMETLASTRQKARLVPGRFGQRRR